MVLPWYFLTRERKNEVSSFFRSNVMERFQKFLKVGHVNLATPPLGVIPHPLCSTGHARSNKQNTMSLTSAVLKVMEAVSSFFRSKVMEGFPKFKKVGHVALDTPTKGHEQGHMI